jgi:drug/metabolite transporter (DMT)-like permease
VGTHLSFSIMGESFAFGAAICWAIGPLIAYRGVEALGTFRFSQYRFIISAFILFLLALGFGRIEFFDTHSILLLVVSGIVGVAFGEAVLFQAVYYIGPRIASIVFSLHAPITAFVGVFIFSELVSWVSLFGIIVAIAGVYTAIIYKSSSEEIGGEWHKADKVVVGVILAILAVLFQVVGALLSKEVMSEIEPFYASFVRTVSAAIAFIPIFLIFREKSKDVSPANIRYVVYSGLVSTVGGMTLLLAAFAYTEIFRAVIVAALSPVIYIFIMSIFKKEKFPLGAWFGTVLAIGGVVITMLNI